MIETFILHAIAAGGFLNKETDAAAEAERMLEEREEELRRRLKGFEDGTTKQVQVFESAKMSC